MSKIAERIGTRYDAIIAHFRAHPLGLYPPDMTVLSLLPPIDRVLILERLFAFGSGHVLDLVDKLSMAYLKAGYDDLANRFIRACVAGGWIMPEHGQFFLNKLADLPVHGVSDDYRDTLRKLPSYEALAPHLAGIIRNLCEEYADREVFAGLSMISCSDVGDRIEFDCERSAFVASLFA